MDTFFSIYFFLFGAIIGSFLNVVILRLPLKKDLVKARSACPYCGTQLRWYHNIPILSFLFLRGRCAFCGKHISWRYPLVEIWIGLCAYWLMPESITFISLSYFTFYFLIACVFTAHFLIDLDHHLLLDSLNLYLLAVILPYAIFNFHWSYWLIGAGIGFGGTLGVTWLFYKVRGQIGLGGGDIKLYGILGLMFGPLGICLTIFLSCFVGAVIGLILMATGKITKDKPMAFGPAILLVASIQIFFPAYFRVIQSFLL